MVLQWGTLKAGLVMCPGQRDGGVEGVHVSDDRRSGSGCIWEKKCIILKNADREMKEELNS